MTPDSFTYNGVDMYREFKIRVLIYDLFMAPLRQRKVIVPGRGGAYDYGAKYHEERSLEMTVEVEGEITDAQFDDLKYTLSRKGRIVLWDKPDRYYIGQLCDPTQVVDSFRHAKREFEVNFLCAPYAYALEPTLLQSTQAIITPSYQGTRETPTRISITNTGSTPMENVRITARTVR